MSTKTQRKIFLIFTFSYVTILAAITANNLFGADRFWLGALNLYLPQAMWAAPAIPLSIISLKIARRWIWAPLLCIIWVLGPIMGFCWSPHSSRKPPGSVSLRVMTCNAKYGARDISALIGDIVRNTPDVVLLQDSEGALESPLGEYLKKWNVQSIDQYVIASRLPLTKLKFDGSRSRRRTYMFALPITYRCQDDNQHLQCSFPVTQRRT